MGNSDLSSGPLEAVTASRSTVESTVGSDAAASLASDATRLPPLPLPILCFDFAPQGFTADQMRAYGQQCYMAAVAAMRT